MDNITNVKIAVLATDGVEEAELTEPVEFLRGHGATVTIISDHDGEIQTFKHMDKSKKVAIDREIETVAARDFDALHLPGGALNADKLRVDKRIQKFVREFDRTRKPIAAICHAPWILISAGLVKMRNLTSYHTIQDDIVNAGGHWKDQAVVEDRNWITSRKPDDIAKYNQAFLDLLRMAHAKKAA